MATLLYCTAFLFALFLIAPAHAWDVRKATTNLDVVTLSDAELATRKIKRIAMGDLQLPTGEIVACDVLVTPDWEPVERKVPPGVYPVTLYEAQGRIAAAVLRFGEGAPVSWEIATIPGQDVSTLKDDEIVGYPVDAGTGSFFDKTALAAISERERLEKVKKPDYSNYYDDVLADEYDDYVMHRPLPDNPINVAVFHSGWGDGFYASYWGLDAAGKPLVLLTDFEVLESADARTEYDRVNAAAIAAMPPQQVADIASAYDAIQKDDIPALERLLSSGTVTPEAYVAETGYTLTIEAIRNRKPKALEALVRHGAEKDVPKGMIADIPTYADYARQIAAYMDPKQSEVLALLDVVRRWEADEIPLAR